MLLRMAWSSYSMRLSVLKYRFVIPPEGASVVYNLTNVGDHLFPELPVFGSLHQLQWVMLSDLHDLTQDFLKTSFFVSPCFLASILLHPLTHLRSVWKTFLFDSA